MEQLTTDTSVVWLYRSASFLQRSKRTSTGEDLSVRALGRLTRLTCEVDVEKREDTLR